MGWRRPRPRWAAGSAGQQPQLRLEACRHDGQVAGRRSRAPGQDLLDQPVLQRVVGQHGDPAAEARAPRRRSAAPTPARRARRSPRSAAPGRSAWPGGHRSCGRPPGSRRRAAGPAGPRWRTAPAPARRRSGGRSGRRTAPRRSCAGSGQLGPRIGVEDLGRGQLLAAHPHVQRRVDGVREPASGRRSAARRRRGRAGSPCTLGRPSRASTSGSSS